ncbi:M50 family metallopeptidase [Ruminococcus albus]|uniref:Membrane-associated zinc metalloprotease n=1 Tax=Ruminococcus albus (strain ATCC 27210 / DSM 20455 / JCM 14654 / NCDO 2250 / 7) TaxID=697329 RepID=E6UBJ2_RUMA7|nr:site-2 protease family protein [Ruminococcus albus]ADU22612.1 membrane-associated zinc metalloprotease [Ruminococcus albus 7 = DSM 20455]
MSIIVAVVIFSLIITIHEFGHFIAAKANGVKVNEFAIGMGPALFKKKKGETLYALRIFPIGGYCAMEGEDTESADGKAFCQKAVWRRMIIVVAGVCMNLILGLILIMVQTCMSDAIATTTISKFEDKAVSQQTGLKVDDKIIAINGMRIFTSTDMSYKFSTDDDGVYDMVVVRNGKRVSLKDVKLATSVNEEGQMSIHYDFWVEPQEVTAGSVVTQAFKQTATDARLIYISLADIIRGKYSLKDMSGPVGIVDSIGDVIDSERDEKTGKINWKSLMYSILYFSSFISINVGVFNILPLPALDGGRFIFLLLEAIRRKPVPPEKEGMVHTIGMAALLLLMVVITVSDITKLV